jgi:hypothetical protein
VGLLILGCATSYQPKSFTGGYEEAEIKPGVYFLEFQANAYTGMTTVVKYWHRRADELCAARGQVAEVLSTEQAKAITGAFVNAGNVALIRKPAKSGYIRCIQDENKPR